MTKYVASRNMTEATWEGTTVLNGDVVERVREIKERDGGTISVLGSADLAQTLMAHDLIDEYSLAIHPILLGSGKKLFRDAKQVRTLELVDSTPTTTGVLLTTYGVRPADQRCQCPPPQRRVNRRNGRHLLAWWTGIR